MQAPQTAIARPGATPSRRALLLAAAVAAAVALLALATRPHRAWWQQAVATAERSSALAARPAPAVPPATIGRTPAPAPAPAPAKKAPARSRRPAAPAQPILGHPPAPIAPPAPKPAPSAAARAQARLRAQVAAERRQLLAFRRYLAARQAPAALPAGTGAVLLSDGRAVPPPDAPPVVARVIQAANAIATVPYIWGGGHTRWRDRGYDCSGSVSFALAGAGLLDTPLTSGQFMLWGAPGPGRWITLYANREHVFMLVAGLRFDTGGLPVDGTRWQATPRSVAGFVAVHPVGL